MRKRGEWPSAERSDTRGCGSRIAPTGAREARSRYSGDTASRREWRAKDAGASPCGTVEKPRALSTRRTRPEVPRAVTVGAAAGRTEAGGGELCRTRSRRRICIRRVGRRTPESAPLARRARLPETKPHTGRQTSTGQPRSPSQCAQPCHATIWYNTRHEKSAKRC